MIEAGVWLFILCLCITFGGTSIALIIMGIIGYLQQRRRCASCSKKNSCKKG